jgi:hypothetical protein
MTKTYNLSEPSIFPDLNKKENQPADHTRAAIELISLKYKHFRSVLQYPEMDQMHHLMIAITGLSEDDLGELCPDDAAEISRIIFQSMKKYMELGQTIMKGA